MIKFRDKHLFTFLSQWDEGGGPLDLALSRYFKSHPSLGAQDRKYLGETVYALTRNLILIDALIKTQKGGDSSSNGWRLRLETLKRFHESPQIAEELPPWTRFSVPSFIWDECASIYGDMRDPLFSALLQPAPICIRTNLVKTSRDALIQRLSDRFSVKKSQKSPYGIEFEKREALFATPEFKEGLFEMQDEGSQIIADLIDIAPKQTLLDYCSGSGGKSLAVAHKMKGTGQIHLHDIRKNVLYEAKKRFRRAGVQNAQPLFYDEEKKKRALFGKCDWVIVDAPCSGTGTLRRNPEMKGRLTRKDVDRLIQEQREIMRSAIPFLKKGGRLLYITCSLLPSENEEQAAFFLKEFSLKLVQPAIRTSLPADILFGAIFSFA